MTLEAEVRLIRWAESSTAGRTITIELPPGDGEAHPFRGFPVGHAHGQRFRMAFVAIDDDETEIPVPTIRGVVTEGSSDSPPQDHANSGSSHAPAGGVNSRSILARERYRNSSEAKQAVVRACRRPKDQQFREWAGCADEQEAIEFIRATIGGSRAMIDGVYEFYTRYMTMETRYLMETGQMAAPR